MSIQKALMSMLPKEMMSGFIGELAHLKLPKNLANWSVSAFAKAYRINTEEAELPMSSYRSVGEFFTRKLKGGARPISQQFCHPCDAQIIQAGWITEQTLVQAKGLQYRLNEFLAHSHFKVADFSGGGYLTYYLCPTDYHRVHVPETANLLAVHDAGGELWPVNDWSVRQVKNLYIRNRRKHFSFQSETRKFELVMVGATNVGSIEMIDSQKTSFNRGDELAMFRLGSTVVLLLDSELAKSVFSKTEPTRFLGMKTKVGSALVE